MKKGLSYQDIAERYDVSRSTIVNRWRKNPLWPDNHVRKLGRVLYWDEAAIERVAADEAPRQIVGEADDDALLTDVEVCAMFDPPMEPGTLRAYRSRGQWVTPAPESEEAGTALYRWGDVKAHVTSGRRTKAKRSHPRVAL